MKRTIIAIGLCLLWASMAGAGWWGAPAGKETLKKVGTAVGLGAAGEVGRQVVKDQVEKNKDKGGGNTKTK